MKKIVLMVFSVLMATAALAQVNKPKTITLTDKERQLVGSNNDFAFRLFRQARGEESSILSPLSITYALGMMNNGAAGQTQREINDVLGFGDAGADGINQFCRKMLSEAPTLDEETTAEIANTIYVNSGLGYELQEDFAKKAKEYYDATPEALNFYDVDESIDIINQWGNEHTHGMIPQVLDNNTFNPDATSYLLNALYFKGVWANKFDKADTRNETFEHAGPDKYLLEVPMMRQRAGFEYTETDLYQAVRLPYGNGAYEMTIFLPREGKTIDDVLATMDGHHWQFQGNGFYSVDLKLPRFKTDKTIPLVKVMSELGMPTAFSIDAEFPYFGIRSVYISNMFQKAVIDLDEEGTKAAAITVIETNETSVGTFNEATFHANRPFFYVINESSTGTIFFMGQYLGDSTTGISQTRNSDEAKENTAVYDLQGRKVGTRQTSTLKKGLYLIGGKKVIVN